MYVLLFELAAPAILGWLLLILLPGWSVTRRLADSLFFPVYVAVLYVVGVAPAFLGAGGASVRDFGSAEGVVRLLSDPDIALVAWLHILAFDQFVAHWIYRDNMEHGYVPVPVQSGIVFLTLLFGPAGFLSYWALRLARRRAGSGRPAHAELPERRAAGPFGAEPALFRVGLLGLALGGLCLGFAAVRGPIVLPEGELDKTAAFDIGSGLYVLTLALLLPLAGFPARARARWRSWVMGLLLYFYAVETIQAFRGLDPRFSPLAGPVDQVAGTIFGLTALGVIATFAVLAHRFFRAPAEGPHALVRLGVRYGAAATLAAFAGGIGMGLNRGADIGAGSLLPFHALGIHGIQAVPIVGLLLMWARVPAASGRRWVHAAGLAWLGACAGLALHGLMGLPLLTPGPGSIAALALLGVWAAVAFRAAGTLRRSGRAAQPAILA